MTNLDDLSAADLGAAGLVEEIKLGGEELTYIRECSNPKAVTILVKGSSEHLVDEIKRALDDAVGGVISALKKKKIVAGAGACEIEVSHGLRQYAESLSGREQLAVLAFADALEIIPRTLAENAGFDPIDVLTELKAAHDQGKKWAGVNVQDNGKVFDAWKEGVLEPLKIKTQAFSSAAEVAILILRIDDVIAGAKSSGGRMPQGMGGMPGMDM